MKLCVVSYSFEQGRRFCNRQGLDFMRVKLVSTDANIFTPTLFGLRLEDGDWLVKYGPYYEGRNAHNVLHQLASASFGDVNEYIAYSYDEAVPWPREILERYR